MAKVVGTEVKKRTKKGRKEEGKKVRGRMNYKRGASITEEEEKNKRKR